MSLSGDFHTMDLADVLEWIANRYKTGTLTVERRATRKGLVLRDGVLRACRSNDPRETLGQYLVRDGLISEEHLFETLLRQEKEQRLLGVMLVEDARVAPEDITRVLREALAESVGDVFLWGEGRFELVDGAPPAEMPFEVSLELATLIHEGQRRRVQWDRIRALASPDTRFRALVGVEEVTDPKEGDVFSLAAAGKTLSEIALRRRRPEFETACLLHSFCERQLLAVAEARRGARVAQRVQMEAIPVLMLSPTALTQHSFNPKEGFLISRINGQWNVQNLLKVCPLPEEDVIDILARLLDRKVIELK